MKNKKAQAYVDKSTGKSVDQNDPASLDMDMVHKDAWEGEKNDIAAVSSSTPLTHEQIAKFEDEYDSDPAISRSMTLAQYIKLKDSQTPGGS